MQPADFSQPQPRHQTGADSTHQGAGGYAAANHRITGFRQTPSGSYLFGLYIPREQQFVLACVLLFFGLVLMMSGI
ncbi:hypothetical protein [Leptodesmis sp.]|uniref:hypothetical protein n=1 Tax=Leptodesmis sp. TaxID=3100501 RepID=UPI00405352F2